MIALSALLLFGFILPWLCSAPNDYAVILSALLLFVVSYFFGRFWVKKYEHLKGKK